MLVLLWGGLWDSPLDLQWDHLWDLQWENWLVLLLGYLLAHQWDPV